MGTSVKGLYNQPKQDFVVVTEAAAAIAVASGAIQLWIGATVDATHKRADIMRGLNTCYDRLREAVPIAFPVSTEVTYVTFTPGAATSLAVITQAALAAGLIAVAPTEDEVLFIYEQNFVSTGGRPSASQLFKGMHVELWERFLEERKAA